MTRSEVQRASSTIEPTRPSAISGSVVPDRVLRRGAKVLPEHARGHNRSLVLQTLFHQGEMSRADIARETALTRVTISDLVAELISDGFVVERGMREASGPGKPAMLLGLDHAGHRIVGLDLSGDDVIIGAVLALDGSIVERRDVPLPAADDLVSSVVELTRGLVEAADAPVLGIGVGTPGVVDDRGVILAAPDLGWVGVDIEGALRSALALPVLVANDADAAVLAEYTFGSAGDDVLLVKVGRGVGSGVLASGRPLRGARFAAGEIGHITVGTDGGPVCVCGKIGCLEAWLSAGSLTKRLAAASVAERDSILRDAGKGLGIALAPVVGALDLSEIVLCGPPELLDGPLAEQALETLRTRTPAELHDGVRVRMTGQGQDIVLRGAAVLVLSGQLGVS